MWHFPHFFSKYHRLSLSHRSGRLARFVPVWQTSGKPSTWFPLGRLVEQDSSRGSAWTSRASVYTGRDSARTDCGNAWTSRDRAWMDCGSVWMGCVSVRGVAVVPKSIIYLLLGSDSSFFVSFSFFVFLHVFSSQNDLRVKHEEQ